MDIVSDPQSVYENQTFRNLHCGHTEIKHRHFEDCHFIQCAFNETCFLNCGFRDCVFKDSDLSLAKVKDSTFVSVKFENCKVIGVNWVDANWKQPIFLTTPLAFEKCTLSYCTFFGLELNKVSFAKCVARDVDFAEADLTEANCNGADFSESRFLNTNLTEANFVGATNYVINVNFNTVKKTKFSLPEAMSLLYSLDIVLVEE